MNASIELVHFDGCPHAEAARQNLREALGELGWTDEWKEWDLEAPDVPDRVRRYGSPTVLVNGADVTGGTEGSVGLACRADGAPSVETILTALGGE